MIKDAKLDKELVVAVPNKIGTLANISKILAEHGINIEGVAGYAVDDATAKIMLVADDLLRARETLAKNGYKNIKENEVAVVDLENKAGALKGLTAKLAAEKIDIKYIYGTTCPTGCPARLIISTTANEKAVVAMKGK